MDEDPFPKNAQGFSRIYHEVLLLVNFYSLNLRLKTLILNITIYTLL